MGLRAEIIQEGIPLLEKVMENGKRLQASPPLLELRQRFQKNFSRLDEKYKRIHEKHAYPVSLSPRLKKIQEKMDFQPKKSVEEGMVEVLKILQSGMIQDPFSDRYRNARLEIQ